MEWLAGTKGHQPCHQSLPKGHTVLMHGVANSVAQYHGAEGDSLPQRPTLVRQSLLLPLVWKGGSKQGHSHKSLMDCALPPGPNMCPLRGFFAMSGDIMRKHMLSFMSAAPEDKGQEEEGESKDDNGDEDDGYLLAEIYFQNSRHCDSHTSHQPACHVSSSVSTLNNLIL